VDNSRRKHVTSEPIPMTKSQAIIAPVVLILAMVLAALLFPGIPAWIIANLCMIAFLLILGELVCKRPLGLLVNERNLMSLSRFQMVLWTLIILSAYFVIAMGRISKGTPDPLAVQIDWRLWTLMGISATSLVGSSLINSTKKEKTTADSETNKTADALVKTNNTPDSLGTDKDNAAAVKAKLVETSQGTLYSNPTIADASFADMFEGDEIGNTAYIDLSKVQMFFFTLILAISYVAALAPLIAKLKTDAATIAGFPSLNDGTIALLGISHASFLVTKGVNHTKQ
jgi:hypothetical protein